MSDNEFRKEFSAGALPSQNVNVFIDGVSFKNDVIDGGVIGQDSSRGNPFPQSAVQEFQVLTQNFKAEYEKAASAIITAVTKSGGNRFTGELFSFYQDKALVENEAIVRDASNLFVKGETTPKPAYERWQWGLALGGPIVRDRAQFFASYEENRQDRAGNVLVGTVSTAPASLVQRLRAFEGLFISPFREKLLFAKTSVPARPGSAGRNHLQLAQRNRHPRLRRAGRQQQLPDRRERAQPRRLGPGQVADRAAPASSTRRTCRTSAIAGTRSRRTPTSSARTSRACCASAAATPSSSSSSSACRCRDDFSRFLKWHGSHTAKVGGVVSFVDYDVNKKFNGNPLFTYRGDISWDFPASANYGAGNPDLSAKNYQFGVFAQDDWAIGPRLTINLGLRWDYESDMLNNDYVTPENVRAATAPFVDNARYFTDGDDRPPFYSAWQPRLGFSYDITGKGQTVAFGGWGRYYDRVLYNSTLDERFRLQYATRTFQFSRDGGIRDGVQTIVWDPSYLSVAGLESIIAQGRAPNPEVFLIANDAEAAASRISGRSACARASKAWSRR